MSLEDQLYPLLDSYNALPRWLQHHVGHLPALTNIHAQ